MKWKPELAISLVALLLSLVATASSIYFSRTDLRANVQPVLVFVFSPQDGWSLRNVGSGPALNILVMHRRHHEANWTEPTRLYPVPQGDELRISWVGLNPDRLGATYMDALGREYTSVCDEDLTTITGGSRLPEWESTDIRRVWERQ